MTDSARIPVDPTQDDRRSFIRKAAAGTAFGLPMIASMLALGEPGTAEAEQCLDRRAKFRATLLDDLGENVGRVDFTPAEGPGADCALAFNASFRGRARPAYGEVDFVGGALFLPGFSIVVRLPADFVVRVMLHPGRGLLSPIPLNLLEALVAGDAEVVAALSDGRRATGLILPA